MALTKPILYTPSAFDATQPYTFTFNAVGGDQVVANRLTIKNQSTNVTVYQQKITSFSFSHTIPANTLTNGVYYSAYITTYNSSDTASTQSSTVQFYCYAEPTWAFSNIPSGNIINNSTYQFNVSYNQAQGEPLNSYSVILYDDERSQVSTSGVKYTSESVLPIVVQHTFSGFDDNQTYYIRAIGTTINGMKVDTGYVQLQTRYDMPDIFTAVTLTNNCDGGYVTVQSNLVNIEGKSSPSPPIYVNGMVDATTTGRYVQWDKNFAINGNFTAELWGNSFGVGKQIIEMSDDIGNTLKVVYQDRGDGKYRVRLAISDGLTTTYVYSSDVQLWALFNKQQIVIQRIDDTYTIALYNLDSTAPDDSAILGQAVIGWMILGKDSV